MPWLGNWRFRRKFTVDSGDVSANLTHFPVLLSLSVSSGVTGVDLSSVFTELQANSQRIAVTKDDGVTELYGEVERYLRWSRLAEIWVSKSDLTLNSASDTDLYFYYDRSQAENTAQIGLLADGTAATEAVWNSGFKGVWHMADATTSTVLDSTSNDNDGSKKAANEPQVGAGYIGHGQHFDGVDDYITCGNDVSLRITPNVTLECNFNSDTDPAGIEGFAGIWDTTANKRSYTFYWSVDEKVRWTRSDDGTWGAGHRSSVYHNVQQANLAYHYYAGTFSAATKPGDIYKDAVNVTTDHLDEINSVDQDTADFTIGCHLTNTTPYRFFDGYIDEVRVSDVVRPQSYLTATYETCRDHFVTWGVEEKISKKRLRVGVGL